MKNIFLLLAGLLLLNSGSLKSQNQLTTKTSDKESTITILSSAALYPLTKTWTDEYSHLNPGLTINLVKITDLKTNNLWESGATLAFISNNEMANLNQEQSWKIVVGRDVIVPVISSKNQFLNAIYQKGISPAKLEKALTKAENQNWNSLLENGQKNPLNYYFIEDLALQQKIAGFLNTNQITKNGTKVSNAAEMLRAIQKDVNAIGFCSLNDIVDPSTQTINENIRILPIDKNGNGKIDYMEKIYADYNSFSRGVWVGKYPKTLVDNIYSVSSSRPVNETEIAFLKWVVTDGQQLLSQNGFTSLVLNERQSQLDQFNNTIITADSSKGNKSATSAILIIIGALIIGGFVTLLIVRYNRSKAVTAMTPGCSIPMAFNENSLSAPKGLYYDNTHTWVFMEENGTLKTGIDDFLPHITGPINRIEMKNTGDKIRKGEKFITLIHEGKKLNVYAPVSGTIIARNEPLSSNSSLLNSSPFSNGWVYQVEPSDWLKEISFLNMVEKYKNWLKNEFSRLRDFVAFSLNGNNVEYAMVALQDGGELKENLLSDLGPEIWEDFQTKFIDTSK